MARSALCFVPSHEPLIEGRDSNNYDLQLFGNRSLFRNE
jgi:hypothetical protein